MLINKLVISNIAFAVPRQGIEPCNRPRIQKRRLSPDFQNFTHTIQSTIVVSSAKKTELCVRLYTFFFIKYRLRLPIWLYHLITVILFHLHVVTIPFPYTIVLPCYILFCKRYSSKRIIRSRYRITYIIYSEPVIVKNRIYQCIMLDYPSSGSP